MCEQETTKFTERFQYLLLLKNSRNLKLHKFQMQKKNSDVAARKKKLLAAYVKCFFLPAQQ